MAGLYIHIPFCRSKCLYCDFYSGGSRIADWNSYVETLLLELKQRGEEFSEPFDTLYIGGGTPSLMPDENFSFLMESISGCIDAGKLEEFTIEVNPEDVSEKKCELWKTNGVNRVSIGVQSMIDNELKNIGRRHTSEEAANAVRLLKKYFDNVSIDVMFGLPGQDRYSYRKTLEEILSLQPQHISSYSLMLEEGTAMTNLVGRGVVNLPDEEEWLLLFEMTKQSLKEAGYEHYEISNYAQPGFESRHNSSYWLGLPYLGLGPGAHSYDGERIRRANPADLKGYLKYYSEIPALKEDASDRYFFIEEYLSNEELAEEMIMTRLRMKSGLNLDEFSDKFGNQQAVRLKEKAENFIERGELAMSGESLHLTEQGILLSDYILSSLI